MTFRTLAFLVALLPLSSHGTENTDPAERNKILRPLDVFALEYASDPRISPDGEHVVYVRNFMDIMHDKRRSNLWMISSDGSEHRPLTTGNSKDWSPRWSPDGKRLLYASAANGSPQLYVRWMDSGQIAKLSNLTEGAGDITWSPDGKWIGFTMLVKAKAKPLVTMPDKPKGAKWAKPAKVVDKLLYRADGQGYLDHGYRQVFVIPAEGGTPRQLTFGEFNHTGHLDWSLDGQSILVSANRRKDWEYDPVESEIYRINVVDGAISQLTRRDGPDTQPRVSPDGRYIAYLGFDDELKGYHPTRLYIMHKDGSKPRALTDRLDRGINAIAWNADSRGLYMQYDDQGQTQLAYQPLKGKHRVIADTLGGTSIGRPYPGASFSVSDNGRIAFTHTSPQFPADVAVIEANAKQFKRLTTLNKDLLAHKRLGQTEELRFKSSHDGREVQGWLVKPVNFDAKKKYPLILEIHGGPFANYGPRFSTEVQLFAAAGYAVLYINPRGSTSYGSEFANLIHHNYPGQDYDDLMSGVDAALAKGFIDEKQLFVTGGSGGGVLTSWIVGKNQRFAAAVVAKPVINWYSFVLTADGYNYFYKYWFPGFPWEHPDHYHKRSPLSLVGNVTTPTMLLTGESDYRTPISESEQYYQALKLRKIDTALVRIPDASHGIANRPSNLISKVAHILAWFEKYRGKKQD